MIKVRRFEPDYQGERRADDDRMELSYRAIPTPMLVIPLLSAIRCMFWLVAALWFGSNATSEKQRWFL